MIWLFVDSSSVGGIERHVATLAEALARFGEPAEVILLADHGGNPWIRQLEAARIGYRFLDGRLGSLAALLRRERPDLIHTHGYKANIMGRVAARMTGVPVVATFHAGERAPFPVSAYQHLDEWTSFLGGRIAVSEPIQRALPFSSTLVANFLVVPPSSPETPLPRRIGFVGRLSHEKGPDRFSALARRLPHVAEWHVYGDGPMGEDLRGEFGADVTFHGLVTDLAPVWASLGLLVMPSRAEGLPMAALESLAAGVPIAAAAVGGLPGVVHEDRTGWLFDGDSLDDAARAVEAWAALDEARQTELRKACWRLVRDGYSERRQLPLVLDVYRSAGFRRLPATLPAA